MPTDVIAVLSTFPDSAVARDIVRTLVEERLIACGNIVPAVESIYTWEGKVEISTEVLGIMKTSAAQCERVKERIRELHPYELPECIALPIVAGLQAYLDWIRESSRGV